MVRTKKQNTNNEPNDKPIINNETNDKPIIKNYINDINEDTNYILNCISKKIKNCCERKINFYNKNEIHKLLIHNIPCFLLTKMITLEYKFLYDIY